MAHIYLICPVRQATPEQRAQLDKYVERLETEGHVVHYPPRDVDQSNDDGALRICQEHRDAMLLCDQVHVWWDNASMGCHFDLGMAYMLATTGEWPIEFVLANPAETPPLASKSFQNLLVHLCSRESSREV